MKDIESTLDGNICRCTGYRPIMDAFKTFAKDSPPELKSRCVDLEVSLRLTVKIVQQFLTPFSRASRIWVTRYVQKLVPNAQVSATRHIAMEISSQLAIMYLVWEIGTARNHWNSWLIF